MKNVEIIVWGFGAMGKGIVEMLLSKKGVLVKGVCDIHPEMVGKNVTEILDVVNSEHSNLKIDSDIDKLLDHGADLVILATDSFTKKAYPKIEKVVTKGINVISTAEEMAYPKASEPELSRQMDALAKEYGVSILGTGINPGFIMDYLVVALSGVMTEVKTIEAKRVNSLSPFGPTVMDEQGVGISLDEFNKRVKEDSLAGHVGFKESVYMIADALGFEIEDFRQQMKPIITNIDRKSKYGYAAKGNLAGIDMTAQGLINNKVVIDMKHPQQIEPELEGTDTGDYIKINGTPNVNMSITPEIDGGIGTIAMCVNMIPHVINASAGLKTMLDLPVPRAIMGDMRRMIK